MSFLVRLRKMISKQKLTVKASFLGLDHAGKTTLITRITQDVFDPRSIRTLGMNVDEFEIEGVKFVCWDIGGQQTFRETLWESYIKGSLGIIYVVDSADRSRFAEAKEELWRYVIKNPSLGDVPILILANKQDLENAASAGEVARALGLHTLEYHSYAIVPTSARTGFNVEESLDWLRQRIEANMLS